MVVAEEGEVGGGVEIGENKTMFYRLQHEGASRPSTFLPHPRMLECYIEPGELPFRTSDGDELAFLFCSECKAFSMVREREWKARLNANPSEATDYEQQDRAFCAILDMSGICCLCVKKFHQPLPSSNMLCSDLSSFGQRERRMREKSKKDRGSCQDIAGRTNQELQAEANAEESYSRVEASYG